MPPGGTHARGAELSAKFRTQRLKAQSLYLTPNSNNWPPSGSLLGLPSESRLSASREMNETHRRRTTQARGNPRVLTQTLKPDGRMVFVEYRKEDPQAPIKEVHKMSVGQLDKEMKVVGLKRVRTVETLPLQHIAMYEKGN